LFLNRPIHPTLGDIKVLSGSLATGEASPSSERRKTMEAVEELSVPLSRLLALGAERELNG
jgi:hypothetical protein